MTIKLTSHLLRQMINETLDAARDQDSKSNVQQIFVLLDQLAQALMMQTAIDKENQVLKKFLRALAELWIELEKAPRRRRGPSPR